MTSLTVPGPWGKPRGATTTFRDILSEQKVECIVHADEGVPAISRRIVAQDTSYTAAVVSQEEEDLALALRLSAQDAAGTAEAPHDADADYALALSIAEAGDGSTRLIAADQRHSSHVVLRPAHQKHVQQMLESRPKPARKLYTADDAEELADSSVGISLCLPGGAPVPAAHLSRYDITAVLQAADEEEDEALMSSLRGRGTAVLESDSSEPVLITKHNAELSARRTARQVERELGPQAGDMTDMSVNPAAIVSLRRHMQKQTVKGTAAHGRVEETYHATQESVLDQRTRMILLKLVNSGRIDTVSGVCKVGKEAAVYRGVGWHEDVHSELAREGWAGQRTQVWGDDEDDGEEEEEEEECDETDGVAGATTTTGITTTTGAGMTTEELAAYNAKINVSDAAHTLVSSDCPDTDTDVALKIFKLTLNEFKDRRDYMTGDRRYARTKLKHQNPRKVIVLWAEKEYKNLVRVHRALIPSPAPLLLRGHVIVMSFLGADGWPAPQLREAPITRVKEWENVYRQVVAIMSSLYKWTHLVHADLSEYNLLYWQKQVYVIDLGQAVDTSHPSSDTFLEMDAKNVTTFFERKGIAVLPVPELIELIKDVTIAPHPPSEAERTGSRFGSVPAVGSGLPKMDRCVLDARVAEDATRGVVHPVATAVLPGESSASTATTTTSGTVTCAAFEGDLFDGKHNPIATEVNRRLRVLAAALSSDEEEGGK